ncbi:MAG: aminotransferase class I/II-fold pyridoxal phosphate-dependent enzyme [Phycisphaerae bacterium]|nr:aminotransferase class I/II-fold pyridoxal phosphate-dependent enzyme [Phycisphaerae bacterium]
MMRPYTEPDAVPFSPAGPHDQPLEFDAAETICTHLGEAAMEVGGPAALPIYQASTFVYPSCADFEARKRPDSPYFEYTRVGNPTTAVLQTKLAALEKGRWCYVLASGMSAIVAALNSSLHAGAHVVACGQCYWPARRYMVNYLPRFGVDTTFVPTLNPDDYLAALRPETRVLYLESPTSGTIEPMDYEALAHEARKRGVVSIIDNSWAGPTYSNPLEFGVDMVVHSATKYIGGHSDVVAGAVIGRDAELQKRVFREVELVGGTTDPFAAWLMLRGLRTLSLRIKQMEQSALAVARRLAAHPAVRRVSHPGLEGSASRAIVQKYFRGTGSLFSFELREQTKEAAYRFVDRLKLFSIGVSWGGHESLALAGQWFSDPRSPCWTVRLHCGLEATTDLVADVEQALQA